jgi:hypothetical protein
MTRNESRPQSRSRLAAQPASHHDLRVRVTRRGQGPVPPSMDCQCPTRTRTRRRHCEAGARAASETVTAIIMMTQAGRVPGTPAHSGCALSISIGTVTPCSGSDSRPPPASRSHQAQAQGRHGDRQARPPGQAWTIFFWENQAQAGLPEAGGPHGHGTASCAGECSRTVTRSSSSLPAAGA